MRGKYPYMDTQEIQSRVIEVISYTLSLNKKGILPECKLIEDFGVDSLQSVELTIALEEEFNLEIPDEDIERMFTVKDIVNYLQKIPKET
jgi:acyl carrier protein